MLTLTRTARDELVRSTSCAQGDQSGRLWPCKLLLYRLGCHKLQVELGRHSWPARICSRCSAAHRATLSCAVDDEYHMIFECERFQALRIDDFTPGTRRFTPGTRTALSRAQGSVRTFMESDPRIVLHFISRCMDILDADSHSHGT